MKNITITVEERVARWARVWAARQGSSLSRLVGELLKQQMGHERDYNAACRRDSARHPMRLKADGAIYPPRDALHER